jgi:glutamate decarboxylase
MVSLHERKPYVGPTEIDMEERVMRLFDESGAGLTDELETDARISSIIRRFFSLDRIISGIEPGALNGCFSESRIPVGPTEIAEYLDFLDDNVVAHSVRTSSPRCAGNMTGGLPFFIRSISRLMTALNQNAVKVEAARAITPFERQAVAMLHRLIYQFPDGFYEEHLHRPESTLGMVVSGGTLSNLTALWSARNAAFRPTGDFAGIDKRGLPAALAHYGYKDAVVIGSSQIHYSIAKSADLLGIGSDNLILIGVDDRHRMDLRELAAVVEQCQREGRRIIAIVGIAGTTNAGAIDRLEDMAEIARNAKAHFHVDATWGGPLLFSEQHRQKLRGIEQADTVAIDGHKQMDLPVGIGMLVLKKPELAKVIEKHADYIVRARSADLGRRTLEGSRPATAMLLHAGLHLFGKDGYGFLVTAGISKARYMARLITQGSDFELLLEPETNIVVYRYIPERFRESVARGIIGADENAELNRINECLQKEQRRQARSFVSRTTIPAKTAQQDTIALRAVLSNPLMTPDDIHAILEDQAALAANLPTRGA